jgi:hypothetical protein
VGDGSTHTNANKHRPHRQKQSNMRAYEFQAQYNPLKSMVFDQKARF